MLSQLPNTALSDFEKILKSRPKSRGALLGRARSLDRLAEKSMSNTLLRKAIDAYTELLNEFGADLTNEHFGEIGERCVDRLRFSGILELIIC